MDTSAPLFVGRFSFAPPVVCFPMRTTSDCGPLRVRCVEVVRLRRLERFRSTMACSIWAGTALLPCAEVY
jgi:hypothetical protein